MRDLSPQPGIEPRPPAVEVQSSNHWTAREVPRSLLISTSFIQGLASTLKLMGQRMYII